jgi:hypothetical protein
MSGKKEITKFQIGQRVIFSPRHSEHWMTQKGDKGYVVALNTRDEPVAKIKWYKPRKGADALYYYPLQDLLLEEDLQLLEEDLQPQQTDTRDDIDIRIEGLLEE